MVKPLWNVVYNLAKVLLCCSACWMSQRFPPNIDLASSCMHHLLIDGTCQPCPLLLSLYNWYLGWEKHTNCYTLTWQGMDEHIHPIVLCWCYGPLAKYAKLKVAHAPGMPGTFSPPLRLSDPDMHHSTCMMYVPWCMQGSLSSGFLWSWWWGRCSRHSRRKRNLQFCVSGKRPLGHVAQQPLQELPFC